MFKFDLQLPIPLKDRLCFGIEFEFALATLPLGTKDPDRAARRQVYSIRTSLKSQYESCDTLRYRSPSKCSITYRKHTGR